MPALVSPVALASLLKSRLNAVESFNRFLTLSLRRGGQLLQPPFGIFPCTIIAFFLRLSYGQFTQPLSRYPCIYEKKLFKSFCRAKCWGWERGGGFQQPPSPLEGRGGSKNKKIFVVFIFLLFPFVITTTMFLKYLRDKVDSVKCFTFNPQGDQFIGQIKAFQTNFL